jgi:small subunit ribosomal protein S6
VLLNIEASQTALTELESGFRFNDAVLRHLIIRRDESDVASDSEPSFIIKSKEKDDAKSSRRRDDDDGEHDHDHDHHRDSDD